MAEVSALADLLAELLSESELRRLFASLGLGVDLPGAGVTQAELCHQAAELLQRRGRADLAFFQVLADRAGDRFSRVVEVAVGFGVSGLREPPPRSSSVGSRAPELDGRSPARRHVPQLIAGVALVLGLAFYAWWRHAPPCATLDGTLLDAGFQPNPGLSARMMPGTVLRVCEAGEAGPRRLASPTIWALATDCFADVQIQEDNWEIPKHTCGSGMELSLEASDLASWLPGLFAHADALRDASVELKRPRLLSLPEMTLGSGFSPACAQRLAATLSPPVTANWFQVVREAIVLDGIELRVRWKGGLDAQVRTLAEGEAAERAKAGGLELRAATRSENETVWEASGPLVLGWRGATAHPQLAGGAGTMNGGAGCP